MEIYHYHPMTGEYLGNGVADESPLEPGVFLVPQYATSSAPTTSPQAYQSLVFSNNSWYVVTDYRGVNICKIDSMGFFVSLTHLELGEEFPSDAVLADDPPEILYKAKWSGSEWIEGATQEEIDAILNAPKPETTEQKIARLEAEKADLQAVVGQISSDFSAFTDFYFEKNPTQA